MKWIRILLFYAIALVGSYVFRIVDLEFINQLELPFGLSILKHLSEGFGPALGAALVFIIFSPKKTITFWGSSRKRSSIMLLIPLLLFSVVGIDNNVSINNHWYGFLVGLTSLLYAVFEELGWRGYLLGELKIKQLNAFSRSLIIGVVWYVWHLHFPTSSGAILDHLLLFGMMVFASWGFEKITDTTQSVASVACFHLLGSILSYNQLIQNGLSEQSRYFIFGSCLLAWIFIVSKWEREDNTN